MDSSPIAALVIIPIFLFFFAGMWMLVLSLISVLGGWRSLAEKYPLSGIAAGKVLKSFSFCSLRLNLFATYSKTLRITIHEGGIVLSPIFIYKFMHKPIFIPWEHIEGVEKKHAFFSYRYKLQVNMRELQFYGNAGEEIYGYYQHFLKP